MLLVAAFGASTPGARASSGTSDQAVAYQIDVAHDGNLTGDTLAPPLSQKWTRTDLGGTVSYPLIAGGMVFVTVAAPYGSTSSPTKWLYALDEQTGATVWSRQLDGTYQFLNAAYDNGAVFVVNFDGLVSAFDASSGASLWSATMPGQYAFTSPPTAANGVLYVLGAGSGGTLYAINETSGRLIWQRSGLDTGDHSSPALGGSSLFVSDVCDAYAFAQADGSPIWATNYGCSGGGGKTVVYSNNRVYARNVGVPGTNHVLDAGTGGGVGTFSSVSAPAFSGSTGFFLSGGTLQAADGSGAVLWSFAGDGGLDTAPIVVNGDVYEGSSSGMLYAVDANTGQSVWSTNVGAGILAPDEHNAVLTTGLGAGEGLLVVPAGTQVSAFYAPPNLKVSGSSVSATEGRPFSGAVATFTDTSGNGASASASIAWGDGTTSAGTVSSNGAGGFVVTGSHAYSDEGSFSTTVTVTDPSNVSASATAAATVADAALTSSGGPARSVAAGSAFTAQLATFADGNANCPAGDYTVTITWGDGTSSSGTLSGGPSCSFNVSGTHTYAVATSYTVTTTIADKGGSATSASTTVTATAPASTSHESVSASNSSPFIRLSAQTKNGPPSGSLTYDAPTNSNPTVAITSSSLSALVKTGTNRATVYGTGTQNGKPVTFTVTLYGNQTSGANTFRMQTSAGYDSAVLSITTAKVS